MNPNTTRSGSSLPLSALFGSHTDDDGGRDRARDAATGSRPAVSPQTRAIHAARQRHREGFEAKYPRLVPHWADMDAKGA